MIRKAMWTIAFTFLIACSANAQQVVNIWNGAAPGTENWTQKEKTIENTPVGTVVLNVVTPTLTAYLPEKNKATGTGVIIAPGGYCVALAISQEGDAARWLQSKGIAAFVLKYRIIEKREEGAPKNLNMDEACKYGIADGIQAIKVVRQHAAEWGVSPDRVGFMGFSAGGMVASGTLLQQDAALRPNFAAPIYGAPFGVMPVIPAKLPPVFMAWAQDDTLAGRAIVKFYDALKSAGNDPEAHIFSSGGHGFGIKKQGTSSDHWIDEFYYWLEAQGLTKQAGKLNLKFPVSLLRGRRIENMGVQRERCSLWSRAGLIPRPRSRGVRRVSDAAEKFILKFPVSLLRGRRIENMGVQRERCSLWSRAGLIPRPRSRGVRRVSDAAEKFIP